jgi:hypothetical protein
MQKAQKVQEASTTPLPTMLTRTFLHFLRFLHAISRSMEKARAPILAGQSSAPSPGLPRARRALDRFLMGTATRPTTRNGATTDAPRAPSWPL